MKIKTLKKVQMKSAVNKLLFISLLLITSCSNKITKEETFEFEESFENIGLSTNYGNVHLKENSEITKPCISYTYSLEPINPETEIKIDCDFYSTTFNNSGDQHKICNLEFSNFKINDFSIDITISFNPQYTDNFIINTDAGRIELNSLEGIKNLDLATTNGTIDIQNVSCKNLKLTIMAKGHVDASGNFQNIDSFISEGNSTITNNIASDSITMETGIGDIFLKTKQPEQGYELFYQLENGIINSSINEIDCEKSSDDLIIKKSDSESDLSFYEFYISSQGSLSFDTID